MSRTSTERVCWKIDPVTGDLVTPLQYVTGVAAAAQCIRVRVRLFRGEWFRDRDKGMPWLPNDIVPERDALLGQTFNELKARGAIRAAILDTTTDNLTIQSLSVTFDASTRRLAIAWRVLVSFVDVAETVEDALALEI